MTAPSTLGVCLLGGLEYVVVVVVMWRLCGALAASFNHHNGLAGLCSGRAGPGCGGCRRAVPCVGGCVRACSAVAAEPGVRSSRPTACAAHCACLEASPCTLGPYCVDLRSPSCISNTCQAVLAQVDVGARALSERGRYTRARNAFMPAFCHASQDLHIFLSLRYKPCGVLC